MSGLVVTALLREFNQHSSDVGNVLFVMGVKANIRFNGISSNYAPTAQVASQQGKYLARVFNQLAKKEELELALEEARNASSSQPIDME